MLLSQGCCFSMCSPKFIMRRAALTRLVSSRVDDIDMAPSVSMLSFATFVPVVLLYCSLQKLNNWLILFSAWAWLHSERTSFPQNARAHLFPIRQQVQISCIMTEELFGYSRQPTSISPKVPGRTLSPNLSNKFTFAANPLVLTPSVRNQMMSPVIRSIIIIIITTCIIISVTIAIITILLLLLLIIIIIIVPLSAANRSVGGRARAGQGSGYGQRLEDCQILSLLVWSIGFIMMIIIISSSSSTGITSNTGRPQYCVVFSLPRVWPELCFSLLRVLRFLFSLLGVWLRAGVRLRAGLGKGLVLVLVLLSISNSCLL